MKKYYALLILSLQLAFASAQTAVHEEDRVKACINKLFEGMRNADSTLTGSAFSKECIMQTIAKTKEGTFKVKTDPIADFIKFVGTPHKEKYDERIVFNKVLIDGNLASVWTDYKFYIDDKFSHCGVNSFQLFKDNGEWKIIYIIDTRRKENCNP